MNEVANDSARVSGQDRKKLLALGTNQIAGFGGFRPLASSEKNEKNDSILLCICLSIYERLYKGEKELTLRSPFRVILPYLPLLHVRAFSSSRVLLIYAFYCKHMESMSPFLN